MAKWKAAIILIFICVNISGQNGGRIGADPAATAANGNIRIIISHAFAPHWSSEASASFRIINDLSEKPFFSEDGHSQWEIAFRYWPGQCHKGASISMGAVHGGPGLQTDMKIGAAYSIPIMKHIDLDIGFGLRLMESIRIRKVQLRDIRIEIYYRF